MKRQFRRLLRSCFSKQFLFDIKSVLFSQPGTIPPQPVFVQEQEHVAYVGRDKQTIFRVPTAWIGDLKAFIQESENSGELRSFCTVSDQPGVLIDVGAHKGFFSALYCGLHPQNCAFALEPSTRSYSTIKEIATLNGFGERLQIEPHAAGERSGTRLMILDTGNNFIQERPFHGSTWGSTEKVEVRTVTLDELCRNRSIVPSILKIDVEGFEYEVLRGASDVLTQWKPDIFLELHLDYLDERQIQASQVLEILIAAGYSFFDHRHRKLSLRRITDFPSYRIHIVARANSHRNPGSLHH